MTREQQGVAAFTFGPAVSLTVDAGVAAASVTVPTGKMIELTGKEMNVEAAADIEADDIDTIEELSERINLPFISG